MYHAVQDGSKVCVYVNGFLKCDHLLKTIEQYFAVELFDFLYKVVLTFVTVD